MPLILLGLWCGEKRSGRTGISTLWEPDILGVRWLDTALVILGEALWMLRQGESDR